MFFSTQFQNIPDPNFLNFYLNIPQAWNMSSSSTPQTGSGYASPILVTGTPPPPKPVPPKAKPTNVFSNDGSFLERFQRTKKVRVSYKYRSLDPPNAHVQKRKKTRRGRSRKR
jgi:hypothetical protein